MEPDKDKDTRQRDFDAKIAEAKAGIERHLKICPEEKAARDLVNGVLNKVLKRRSAT